LNRGHSSEFCRGITQFAAHNARGGFIARLSSVGEIVNVMHSIVVTPYACWAWADVGIVTAINAAMDAAVATR
jgi:hypothetical protein